mmetsp:Transcript_11411/g.17266  ORF Transcript_11411/g.17266 Transcript_11411/m.17266 type:complete len:80 (-) Transcript_11411:1575-1814(-)
MRGEWVANPPTPGTTTIINPERPHLAGRPISNAKPPVKSFKPQVKSTERQFCTVSEAKTRFLVIGLMPPRASVAATMES